MHFQLREEGVPIRTSRPVWKQPTLNHPKLDYGLVLKPVAWGTPILGNPHMNTSHDQHWATYLRNLAERKWD